MIQEKKIIDRKIMQMFPSALYLASLNRDFTQEELDFVQKNKKDRDWRPDHCQIDWSYSHTIDLKYNNEGNSCSHNTSILDCTPFATLKKEILEYVDDYFTQIICPATPVKPYITQSWLNYTEPGQYHRRHNHVNSYLSGGIYINANKDMDSIRFHDLRANMISINSKNSNTFNSQTLGFPVETGDIVIFPSGIFHDVPKTIGKYTRISLAFNVFMKGIIGTPESPNELKL